MDEPVLGHLDVADARLAYAEWRASLRGHAPTVLMSHATGFHGRVWDQLIAHLPGCHVIALDLRGHGLSQATPIRSWEVFGRDVAAVVTGLDLRRVVGVGHSMGAHALIQAASREPDRFEKLILIDPTVLPPQAYVDGDPGEPTDHPVARRNARFDSIESMRDRLAARSPYASFDPQALLDYCRHGLKPAADGNGYELACAPLTEASVYMSARVQVGVYERIRGLQLPVLVVRAKLPTAERNPYDYSFSPTWPEVASQFPNARDLHLAERNHLMPMETPAEIARLIEQELPRQ